jgi:hypothetical protein
MAILLTLSLPWVLDGIYIGGLVFHKLPSCLYAQQHSLYSIMPQKLRILRIYKVRSKLEL